MPEAEVSQSTIVPEKRIKVLINRGGNAVRKIATTLTAAALVAACSGSPAPKATETQDPKKSPPGTEQVQSPYLSVQETVSQLEKNPSVAKGTNSVALTELRSQYKEDDFTGVDGVDFYSAPVAGIIYDKTTNSLRFFDQTPKGLTKQQQYDLLSPLLNNIPLLAAFKAGKLDIFNIRLNKTNPYPDPELADIDAYNGEFVLEKERGPKNLLEPSSRQVQKNIYIYLPGSGTEFSDISYSTLISHEPIHALTSTSSLSESLKSMVSPDDLSQWQSICSDIRNIAVDEAEIRSQNILRLMEANRNLFTDPKILSDYDQVIQALRNGSFNRFEQITGDKIENFGAKVPECRVIGPWPAFIRLLKADGIDSSKLKGTDDLSTTLQQDWQDIIRYHTIFSYLREGTINQAKGAPDSRLGHPYDNWDELITSTTNIIYRYPEVFAQLINGLPANERGVLLPIIEASFKLVDAQIPLDDTESHIKLKLSYSLFRKALGGN